MAKRSRVHKMEKLVRVYDEEILPLWSQQFGKLLLRNLDLPERCQILDVACGTGYPALEVLRIAPESCRLIAIDASSAMLNEARKKIEKTGRKGIFFRTENVWPRLSFADDVYDLVICNLGLNEMPDPASVLNEFVRVTAPSGQVRCSIPLAGTFQEFYDIYREVLTKHDKHEAMDRLQRHLGTYPTYEQCQSWMDKGSLTDTKVEMERFTLLFKSAREFFFAPVIEFGPLAGWKEIVGPREDVKDTFWHIKEAIDAYYQGRAFELTVCAGALFGTKVQQAKEHPTETLPPLDSNEDETDTTVDAPP